MKKRLTATASLLAAAALVLTGCSGDGGTGDSGSGDAGGGSKGPITIAAVQGWDDVVSSSMLWQAVLEEQGYDVEIEYQDIAVSFVGVAEGDLDLYIAAWLPATHADYYEAREDQLENLGSWNGEALNVIAVNEDAPIDTLAELAENADLFGNEIIGIEPGAGLTQLVENDVVPTYGLEDLNFSTSSTPAMLAALETKIDNGENVAVTLWQPHWAYGAYPLKNLEDPEGAFGEPEQITALARDGFTAEYPEVAEWISGFEMDMDTYSDLMATLFVDDDASQYDARLAEWIEDNREWVDSITQ